jgi:dihydropteroate synthase
MAKLFKFADRTLDLSKTQIMGVLNVTPDSFSDGGKFSNVDAALKQAELMITQGASIIDVGGESTRPGAHKVGEQAELDRVCPVVKRISENFDVVVSVDTSTPKVMREVIALGAGLINDVRAFSRPGAIEVVKEGVVALCAMHMKGTPRTMQDQPKYGSVTDEVVSFLQERADLLMTQGVGGERIILDPGFGFGKTLAHNMQLLNNIGRLCALGYPILVGVSRKSMFSEILNKGVDERLFGSLSAASVAAYQGASILRVHDVAESRDAALVIDAIRCFSGE